MVLREVVRGEKAGESHDEAGGVNHWTACGAGEKLYCAEAAVAAIPLEMTARWMFRIQTEILLPLRTFSK